jgi:hypothetical protein
MPTLEAAPLEAGPAICFYKPSRAKAENTEYFFFFSFWQDRGLNSGLRTCKTGTLLLEPLLQFILLWLFCSGV